MKGLLLRVGIDKGTGGCLAPMYDDGSFEYVPIPEDRATREERTYLDLPGRRHTSLAECIPPRRRNHVPHFDPEFDTFTYGDPGRIKRSQIARLVPGDLLVFYAGLVPAVRNGPARLFMIGYFTIAEVYDFRLIPPEGYPRVFAALQNNAHVKRMSLDDELVIVQGGPETSRLLTRAIPVSDARQYVLPELAPLIGYSGSLRRAVGHWVDEGHFEGLRAYLSSDLRY